MPWEQLKEYLDENRREAERERAEPPVACPRHADPLDIHPDGRRNCPLGDFRWPR
jgi:hypothetical protein